MPPRALVHTLGRHVSRVPGLGAAVEQVQSLRRMRREIGGLRELAAEAIVTAHRLRQDAAPAPHSPPPAFPRPGSVTCRESDFLSSAMGWWCRALGEERVLRRATWERVFVAARLAEAGVLAPGKRGVGFGVGAEPLPAYFAARGAEVLATDLAPDAAEVAQWAVNGQYAGNAERLNERGLCDPDVFRERVTFRPLDMREPLPDLEPVDFLWSACAFEHLGDLDAGLRFVRDSARLLKPGGIAVHTTEFNVFSDDDTVATGPVVFYRRRDMHALAAALASDGLVMEELDFDRGDSLAERFVDAPPFQHEPHITVRLGSLVFTSFGLVIRRREG